MLPIYMLPRHKQRARQIHTGLQHGIIQNSQRSCLPPKFGTMADAFKAANFSTHMIGKWHLCAPRSRRRAHPSPPSWPPG